MKQNIKPILATGIKIAIMIVCPILFFPLSCDNINSIHEEYLKRGETIYIGSADSVKVYSGNQKIKFEWKINSDPRITKTVIYWDQRSDSVTIPVNRTSVGEMWMETQLNNLKEAEYVFEFVIKDDKGNISKPIEISGAVLGDVFIENLRNRGVKEIAKLETGDMQITWDAVNSNTLQYSIIEYINNAGAKITANVPNDDTKTLLQGLSTGDDIEICALHIPENALEPFLSTKRKFIMPKFEREIAKSRFTAAFKPGDNTTPHPGGGADDWMKPITDFGVGQRSLAKIWDGGAANNSNNMTILHTEDQSGNADARFKFPHHFTFDIGVLATLSRLHFWGRTDAGAFTGHSPRFFELWATDVPKEQADFSSNEEFLLYYKTTYVEQKNPENYLSSSDEVYVDKITQAQANSRNYVAPAPQQGIYNWQKDWIKLGDFELGKPSGSNYNTSNDADKAIWSSGSDFNLIETGKKVRYLRLVVKYPNWQNTNCINIGEITLYGDDI